MNTFDASVIVPTYNRIESLVDTLDSLAKQEYDASLFEVIVVDDGSSDGTQETLAKSDHPFLLRVISQENQGSAVARNTGAQSASGRILIFLDDDMWVESDYVGGLIEEHNKYPMVVGMGTELPYLSAAPSPFAQIAAKRASNVIIEPEGVFVDFTHCVTNNISIEYNDFFRVGMMQDIAGDGPTWWGDVDFGYRAHLHGFKFRRSGMSTCYHRDYSISSLETMSNRSYKAARMAVQLFQKFPEIQQHLPMFEDKTPVNWREDPFQLILRKLIRRFTSSQLCLSLLEQITNLLERTVPILQVLRPLYRWIVGGYIFRGYRDGLRQLDMMTN